MPETKEARTITVRCLTHNIDFEIESGERIVCPAGPHALAQGFPTESFWEYCCDCQRYWPSNLNHGGISEAHCLVCSRTIARRYLCGKCKIVSVESDDRAVKRKSYSFTPEGVVIPSCPGCSAVSAGTLHRHECDEIGARLTTPREVCPFCEKATSEKKIEQKIETKQRSTPRVKGSVAEAGSAVVVDQSATVQSKVQVSICPRCGTARRKPGDPFCGKCGALFADSSQSGVRPIQELKELVEPNRNLEPAAEKAGALPLKLIFSVVGAVAILGIVLAISSLSGSGNSVEKKLDRAIAAGNIFSPSNENAQELYQQLINSRANEETLKRYREKLTPLLTKPGYQLSTNILIFGYTEPTATEWQAAARSLDWAVELNPGDGYMAARAAYCNGRAAFVQNSKSDEAVSTWTRAANLDKSWALPVNGIGLIYNSKRDYSSARSYFSDAINREPNWAVPYENMANAYYMEKKRDRAREFYAKAAAKAADWAKPHVHLADMAVEDRDYATAVSEFEKALSLRGLKSQEITKVQERLETARQRLSG